MTQIRRINSLGYAETIDSSGETDIDQVVISPSAPPVITVQPLTDYEIPIPNLDANRQGRNEQIDDIPTFHEALQMEVISIGKQARELIHQTSSKSDDLPPAYDSHEFHPVLLPGNTHYTYFDTETVQSGSKANKGILL